MIKGLILLMLPVLAASLDDCDTMHTDRCGQLVWPFVVDTTLTPKDEVEKAQTCKTIQEGYECTRDFLLKCPDKIKKDDTDDLLDSLNVTIHDFCNGPLGKRFMPYGQCLKEKLGGVGFTCNEDAIATIEAAAVSEPLETRLKLSCCAYLKFDKCFKEASTKACGRRAARAIRNLVQSYAIFMVEKCIGFLAGPERCDLTSLEGLKPINNRKAVSAFPALIDVIATTF